MTYTEAIEFLKTNADYFNPKRAEAIQTIEDYMAGIENYITDVREAAKTNRANLSSETTSDDEYWAHWWEYEGRLQVCSGLKTHIQKQKGEEK